MKRSALIVLILTCATVQAKPVVKPAPAKAAPVKAASAEGGAQDVKRALASVQAGSAPKRIDPNAALEVRGQSRTLSMMLVLKNGKDSINFIKVRRDYRPEIEETQY